MDRQIRILIEANKIFSDARDGIYRYMNELLHAMGKLIEEDENQWHIDIFMGQKGFYSIINLKDSRWAKYGKLSTHNKVIKKFRLLNFLLIFKDACIKLIKLFFPKEIIKRQKQQNGPVQAFIFNRYPSPTFKKYDIVHLTQPQSYRHFQNCEAKMITTVHDLTHLYFPDFHLRENIDNANHGMRLAIEKKSEFIAVSKSTRKDLLSSYPVINPETVHVVYEACNNQQFKPSQKEEEIAQIRMKYGIANDPFILSLSTIEPRKNLLNAVKAFLKLIHEHPDVPINFVIAGKKGWRQKELLNKVSQTPDRIIRIGFVDEDDLSKLYSAATAFSYVSFYEGFGLPAVEAMSCGTPVVYGKNGALPEIIGDGGLMVNPDDIDDIKEKYKILVMNGDVRDRIAKLALARSEKFSWESTARQTLEIYRKIASKK